MCAPLNVNSWAFVYDSRQITEGGRQFQLRGFLFFENKIFWVVCVQYTIENISVNQIWTKVFHAIGTIANGRVFLHSSADTRIGLAYIWKEIGRKR